MKKIRMNMGLVLLIVGIVFVVTGVFLGEARIVFTKAAMICLECIGIG